MAFTKQALRGFTDQVKTGASKMIIRASVEGMVRAALNEKDRVISESVARSGITPSYVQVVDGVVDAPLESVKPDGVIYFKWQYLGEVALKTYQALVARSPQHSGEYIRGIKFYVDGTEADGVQDITISSSNVKIAATVPYSRRIEVGRRSHGRSTFVVNEQQFHNVEETAIVARRLYGNIAQITFAFEEISNAYTLRLASSTHRRFYHTATSSWRTGRTQRMRHGKVETDILYPTITIVPRVA